MIITTANISTSFHGSHCNFLTSLHGRPQIFKQVFTGVIRNLLTIRENRIIVDLNIVRLISSVSGVGSGASCAAVRCSVLQRIVVCVSHLTSGATCVAVRCSAL